MVTNHNLRYDLLLLEVSLRCEQPPREQLIGAKTRASALQGEKQLQVKRDLPARNTTLSVKSIIRTVEQTRYKQHNILPTEEGCPVKWCLYLDLWGQPMPTDTQTDIHMRASLYHSSKKGK